MPTFEPYIPLSVRYPLTVAFVMDDPVPLLLENAPVDVRNIILAVNDDCHDVLATVHSKPDRQIKFFKNKARDIVRRVFPLCILLTEHPRFQCDVEEVASAAAKLGPFCDHFSSAVNKVKQYAPMASNPPAEVLKMYEVYDAVQAMRRRFAKAPQATLTIEAAAGAAVADSNARKVRCRSSAFLSLIVISLRRRSAKPRLPPLPSIPTSKFRTEASTRT